MRNLALTFAWLLAACVNQAHAAPEILKQEPAKGTLSPGQVVYVDDRKCPKGQVTQITGGQISANTKRNFGAANTRRERTCVPRP